MASAFYTQRWYDQDPSLASFVGGLEQLEGEDNRVLFSKLILHVCQVLKRRNRKDGELLKLGADRIMGVLKAQGKRRASDRDTDFFKAMTAVYQLEDEKRLFVAARITESIQCLAVYEKAIVVRPHYRRRDLEEVAALLRQTLEHGLSAGLEYLESIGLQCLLEEAPSVLLETETAGATIDLSDEALWADSLWTTETAGSAKDKDKAPPKEVPTKKVMEQDKSLKVRKKPLP